MGYSNIAVSDETKKKLKKLYPEKGISYEGAILLLIKEKEEWDLYKKKKLTWTAKGLS